MKEKIKVDVAKKYTTDLDTVITRENVLYLCENMALCALKRMIGYRGDYELRMYYNLVGDIKGKNNINHIFSDSYDLVQTACLFLLNYVASGCNLTMIKPIFFALLGCYYTHDVFIQFFHQNF